VQNGYVISGNGSGLTNVSATDSTKLPLSGGTLTGALTTQNIAIQNGYYISGNGAGLTNVTATDSTKLPLAGGTMTGTITSRDITVQNGYVISGNGSGLTNVNDTSKLPLTGGTLTGTLTSRSINIQNGYIISGDGSGLTNVTGTDATKLPLAGGTMTGTITSRDISVQSGYAIRGNGNSLSTVGIISYDQTAGQQLYPPGASTGANAKRFNVILNYQNTCTVNLRDLYPTQYLFPDQVRYVTIIKKGMASGLFSVTVTLPVQAGYVWRWAVPESDLGTGSITMGTNIFSYTFMLLTDNAGSGIVYLVNKVTM